MAEVDDKTMDRWEQRMKDKQPPVRPEALQYPWNTKMMAALEKNIGKVVKCPSCKLKMKPKEEKVPPLLLTFPFDVFQEAVPLCCCVCTSCGTVFAFDWSQAIIQDARERMRRLQERG